MALFVSSRSIWLYEIKLSKASPFSFRTAHVQQAVRVSEVEEGSCSDRKRHGRRY